MTKSASSDEPVIMTVRTLVLDPVSNMPVVVLENPDSTAFLPIWIGVCEANAIALVLEGVTTPRPMTHDLIPALLEATGYSIQRIRIHTLADNVFHASIQLANSGGESREVDARPSDALAVALRTRSEIVVDPGVLDRALVTEGSEEDAIKMILERLRPEDMPEYEM
jgi:bifunctional DNase/RNase